MGHEWDETKKQGIMVGQPSWHRMEKAVLTESPKTWDEAKKAAALDWDVTTEPVYTKTTLPKVDNAMGYDYPTDVRTSEIEGWQAIRRDDTAAVLAIQKDSYKVIYNRVLGDVIDTIINRAEGDPLNLEALFSLYGGRMIVALMRFPRPLKMSWDPSENVSYLSVQSRHDGNGGLHGIPTTVRTVCANTIKMAEAMDTKGYGFTIRHTSNWEERLEEVARGILIAQGDSEKWVEFSEQLARYKVNNRQRDKFLTRWMPASDDMTTAKRDHVMKARDQVRTILDSETCDGIRGNGYGLMMASTQYTDHSRGYANLDSYISRQLTTREPMKVAAAGILSTMAGVKL